MENYKLYNNPLKQAFYREVYELSPYHNIPDNHMTNMWELWKSRFRYYTRTYDELEDKYYLNPKHTKLSIYDWNVGVIWNGWFEKNYQKYLEKVSVE
jgi:hypothetical protein